MVYIITDLITSFIMGLIDLIGSFLSSGVQYVMISGQYEMLQCCVVHWAINLTKQILN